MKMYTKSELEKLVFKKDPDVLKVYDVMTFEDMAAHTSCDVSDLIEDCDKWSSYGGRIVGHLLVKEQYSEVAADQGFTAGEIWENGFCGIAYGSDGREHWATGLSIVKPLANGAHWDEEVFDWVNPDGSMFD